MSFSEDKLMDSESKAVMMAWENPLMEAHAKAVCSGGGHVLNIGFGMGLVDSAIQRYAPASHTIVEAHPEVYERMLSSGWGQKESVKIVFGRWQDVLPQLETYDGNCYSSNLYLHKRQCLIAALHILLQLIGYSSLKNIAMLFYTRSFLTYFFSPYRWSF